MRPRILTEIELMCYQTTVQSRLFPHHSNRFRTALLTDFDRAVANEGEFGSRMWLVASVTLFVDLAILVVRVHDIPLVQTSRRWQRVTYAAPLAVAVAVM